MKLSDEQAKKFAFNLSRILYSRGLTQADLARMTGLSAATISGWMWQAHKPSYESVVMIASALKLPCRELIGRGAIGVADSRGAITIGSGTDPDKFTTLTGCLKEKLRSLVEGGYFENVSAAAREMIALGLEVWERENNREEKVIEPENNSEPNVKKIRAYELKDLPLKVVREEPRRKEPPRKLRLIDTLFDDGYALK